MSQAHQLTITDRAGRSFTFEGHDLQVSGVRPPVARVVDPAPAEATITVRVYEPRQRSPGPHTYRWPAPRR